jgi:hypothetical protein
MTTDPPPPTLYDTRIGPGGVLEYYDGTTWVRYEDPPEPLTGGDPEPQWLEKGAATEGAQAEDDEGGSG